MSYEFDLQFFATQGRVEKSTIGTVDPNTTPSRLDINCDKEIMELYPNADPFIVLLNKARKKPVDSIRFEWYDSRPMAWWTAINNGAGYADNAVSMVVDDSSVIPVGAIIKIPRTGEEIYVGANNTGTNTISSLVRAVGSTAAAAINDNDDIMVMPNAMADGYTTPGAVSTQPDNAYNYVQTLSTPVNLSEQAEDVAKRAGGSERDRLRREALFQHRTGMERISIFGERAKPTLNSKVVYKTGGINSFISSNVFNLGGAVLTEYDLDDMCEQVFRTGSDTKVLVCGGLMKTAITRFGKERVVVSEKAKSYGLSLYEYQAACGGTLMIAKSQTFNNYYAGWGTIVDVKNVRLRQFNPTRLRPNQQQGTSHEFIDEYQTEFGMEIRLQETHGLIKNMKTS